MSISYRVDPVLGIVFVKYRGVVTVDELSEHLRRMFTDEEALACGKSITDTREAADMLFHYDDLWKVHKTVVEPLLGERRWKTALTVQKPFVAGVVHQFQMIAGGRVEVSAFPDEASALEWVTR